MNLAYSHWFRPNSSKLLSHERLIFLHGMGGTGALWRPIAAALEEQFECLAPDQRGHGKSPAPEGSTFLPEDFGRDIVDTLRLAQFHPCWGIGHSMGVRAVVAAAHQQPVWFKGLILVDLGFSGPAGGGLGESLANFLKVLPSEFADRQAAREFMAGHCPDPAMAQYLLAVAAIHPQADGRVRFPFQRESLIATVHSVRDQTVRPWIRELAGRRMPILCLRGAESLVWSEADYKMEREHFKDLPSIQFRTIQGTGHGLPFDKRLEFVQIIQDFCRTRS